MKKKKKNQFLDILEQPYKVIKVPLKSVLKNYDKIQPIIENTIKEINQLVILSYQFLKLYLLDKFNNNLDFPNINKQFLLDIFKVIGYNETSRGKSTNIDKIKNKSIKDDLKNFYQNVFNKLVTIRPNISNKSHILEQTAKEMLTCINNNISLNFIKYLGKYINELFKNPLLNDIKEKYKDKKIRKEKYKELNLEIQQLKNDLLNNKIEKSNTKYHQWIKYNKFLLFPKKIEQSIVYDIKVNPEKYIKYSFYVNQKIEELNTRNYNVIPQRNNIIPKHITLNTSAIVDIINDKKKEIFLFGKSEMILNCKKYQKHTWKSLLKLEKKSIFKLNSNYVFYNEIKTDGFDCILLFINKKFKDKEFGDKLPDIDNEIIFDKLEDFEKGKCKKYLEGNYKFIGVDPGKIRPFSMIDEEGTFFKYSAMRRRFENYSKRSNYIIQKEKENNNIIEKETELSKFNSRTLNIEKYKDFIKNKNKLNNETKEFYNRILLRKLSFRIFAKTKQSEDKLLNEIENKYLTKEEIKNKRKIVLFYGDYSRSTAMKGCISTPNLGLKRLLSKRFEIFDINEYKTSKLYNKNYKELINVKIRKGKHQRLLHEVLTLIEDTEKRIYVNRDVNACKNILSIGLYYLKYRERPKEFIRNINSCLIKNGNQITLDGNVNVRC
jgi:hypothetical protein